jgi:hypothetical protein
MSNRIELATSDGKLRGARLIPLLDRYAETLENRCGLRFRPRAHSSG